MTRNTYLEASASSGFGCSISSCHLTVDALAHYDYMENAHVTLMDYDCTILCLYVAARADTSAGVRSWQIVSYRFVSAKVQLQGSDAAFQLYASVARQSYAGKQTNNVGFDPHPARCFVHVREAAWYLTGQSAPVVVQTFIGASTPLCCSGKALACSVTQGQSLPSVYCLLIELVDAGRPHT